MQATPVALDGTQTAILRPLKLATELGFGQALILRTLLQEAIRYAALSREERAVATLVIDDLDRLMEGAS